MKEGSKAHHSLILLLLIDMLSGFLFVSFNCKATSTSSFVLSG